MALQVPLNREILQYQQLKIFKNSQPDPNDQRLEDGRRPLRSDECIGILNYEMKI